MRVALVTPPATQLNTPYPATGYLARALQADGYDVRQADLGLSLMLRLFSPAGLSAVFDAVEAAAEQDELPEPAWAALAARDRHQRVISSVVGFLQGRDRTLARRIVAGGLLPESPRVAQARASDALSAFGRQGQDDAARYLATLYLEDLADLVTSVLDVGFGFSRYQHHLAAGPVSYAPIAARLAGQTLIDGWLDDLTDAFLDKADPAVLGITVPFPGTLYGALRIGQRARARGVLVVLGGGYISTELREVEEPRLWLATDALVYDDGEGPLRAILEHVSGLGDRRHRTRTAAGLHSAPAPAPAFNPAPWYGDLPLDRYMSVVDTLNPTHRLWSDGRWNKLTLAHGCYWRRCAFCDIHLDYIQRYEPAEIDALLDHMQRLVQETGTTGFHLVDEAAPPRLLRALAIGLLQRGLSVQMWGNIRFERAFSPDLCRLLAAAGLIAVTGGLEVASDRLLRLMDKGITVDQAARAASAFQSAGVSVHAYLMFGFPTETDQETIDSQEVVRQMFAAGLLSSAFWHRFVMTRHSAVFADPKRFSVEVELPTEAGPLFATNDIPHRDPTGGDHDRFDAPLAASLGAWMRGEALDRPVHQWTRRAPKTTVAPDLIPTALRQKPPEWGDQDRLLWLGDGILELEDGLQLHHAGGPTTIGGPKAAVAWLSGVLEAAHPTEPELRWGAAKARFPGELSTFSRQLRQARAAGLVAV